jgi:hypothetical protein
MSEERRKRRQSRHGDDPGDRRSKTWIYVVVIAAFAVGLLLYRFYLSHRYDSFAKCLAAHQAKMYGLYWCPHCAEQKEKFGAAFRYVPYQECALKEKPGEMAPQCKAAGVKLFPSWQFGSNAPIEGVFSLDELSDKTGCSLP